MVFEVLLVTGGLDNTDIDFLYLTSTEVLYPGSQAWTQVGELPRHYGALRVGSTSLESDNSRINMRCKICSALSLSLST